MNEQLAEWLNTASRNERLVVMLPAVVLRAWVKSGGDTAAVLYAVVEHGAEDPGAGIAEYLLLAHGGDCSLPDWIRQLMQDSRSVVVPILQASMHEMFDPSVDMVENGRLTRARFDTLLATYHVSPLFSAKARIEFEARMKDFFGQLWIAGIDPDVVALANEILQSSNRIPHHPVDAFIQRVCEIAASDCPAGTDRLASLVARFDVGVDVSSGS